jgi:hypothetical protein
MGVTAEEVSGAIQILKAVADTIKELGSVPSGELYAMLSGRMSLENYTKIINILKNAPVIKEEHHLLIWIGGN